MWEGRSVAPTDMTNRGAVPHSAALRFFRRKEGEGVWFVTKTLQPRKDVLLKSMAASICLALGGYVERGKIHLGSFVVMPDHWHALIATREAKSISEVMKSLNHWISRQTQIALREQECQWQEGFYETRIQSVKQFQFVRNYIEANPVRAKLVAEKGDWPWTTANDKWSQYVADPWPVEFENV
jgi:REP element-mobilizing transposase RayT